MIQKDFNLKTLVLTALLLTLFSLSAAQAEQLLYVANVDEDNVLVFNGDNGGFIDVFASGGG
ncbi:MAG: hypothetical protein AAF462_10665, partial [Thermodesulfobacteriota bacterium]